MNKEYFKKKGTHVAIILGVLAIVFMLSTKMVPTPRLELDDEGFAIIQFDPSAIASATEASPAAGASSILEIFFVNHTATGSTAYDTNTSSSFETWANASCDPDGTGTTYYAYSIDVLDGTMTTLTVKWGVDMDMVVRYRGNATNAKNATIFNAANCRIKVNATGGGCTALTSQVFSQAISKNTSTCTYIWINAYYNIGTLNKGATYTITNVKLEFNY